MTADAAPSVEAAPAAGSALAGAPIAVATPGPGSSTVPVLPAVSTPATAVAPQQLPLATQIARPLFTLASAKPGDHSLTIRVSPDNFGPVTVRAHVSADGIRIELFAPSDGGRDALRQVLGDLRRDVASAGLTASLDLSGKNHPDTGASDRDQQQSGSPDERARADANRPTPTNRQLSRESAPYRGLDGSSSTLDVLA